MSERNLNIRINIESHDAMTVNIININRDRDKSEREMIVCKTGCQTHLYIILFFRLYVIFYSISNSPFVIKEDINLISFKIYSLCSQLSSSTAFCICCSLVTILLSIAIFVFKSLSSIIVAYNFNFNPIYFENTPSSPNFPIAYNAYRTLIGLGAIGGAGLVLLRVRLVLLSVRFLYLITAAE